MSVKRVPVFLQFFSDTLPRTNWGCWSNVTLTIFLRMYVKDYLNHTINAYIGLGNSTTLAKHLLRQLEVMGPCLIIPWHICLIDKQVYSLKPRWNTTLNDRTNCTNKPFVGFILKLFCFRNAICNYSTWPPWRMKSPNYRLSVQHNRIIRIGISLIPERLPLYWNRDLVYIVFC